LDENYYPDVRTSARVRVYPADAVLPEDGFLPSVDAGPRRRGRGSPRAWTRVDPCPHGGTDVGPREHGSAQTRDRAWTRVAQLWARADARPRSCNHRRGRYFRI
jgi:hypothetical protein